MQLYRSQSSLSNLIWARLLVYSFASFVCGPVNVCDPTYNKKYRPQLDAPPTRFGIKPLYSPFQPSATTASSNARYTAVPTIGFRLVLDRTDLYDDVEAGLDVDVDVDVDATGVDGAVEIDANADGDAKADEDPDLNVDVDVGVYVDGPGVDMGEAEDEDDEVRVASNEPAS